MDLATEQRKGRARRNILGFAISIVSIVGVVWWASKQDPPTFPDSASALLPLAAAVGVYGCGMLVRGWRWHLILRQSGIQHRVSDAEALTVVCYMGNTVLPARGGEILRMLLMAQRTGARRREILGTIIAERLLDLVSLVVLFATMTWVGFSEPLGYWPAIGGVVALVAFALAISAYIRLRQKHYFERFADLARPFLRASRLLMGRGGVPLAAVTLVIWSIEALVLWLVVQSIDVPITFFEGAFLVLLTSLVVAVPAAPGYIGTFDAALVLGLSALGVGSAQALGLALLWRFVLFVPVTVVGLTLVFARYGGIPRRAATASFEP